MEKNGSKDNKYIKVPIKYLLQFDEDFFNAEIFIKLGDEKYVKITLKDDGFKDTIKSYSEKGLIDVYLFEQDYLAILGQIKLRISNNNLYDPETIKIVPMESLESMFNMAKDVIVHFGATPEVITLCKNINTQALKFISNKQNIFKYFKEFKENCSDEFLKSILTSHLMMLMIDQFSWRSSAIKEKAALGCLLCDIVLSKDDFKWFEKKILDKSRVPEVVLKHPLTISNLLKRNGDLVSMETLSIIEQHHELPDGSGFPLGLTANRIHQLSAIYIVSHYFITQLVKENFNYEKKDKILKDIHFHYNEGPFEKIYEILYSIAK